METKNEVAYKKVLGQFKTKFPNVRPTTIMIDFETGLHNAFQHIYPEATLLLPVTHIFFHLNPHI